MPLQVNFYLLDFVAILMANQPSPMMPDFKGSPAVFLKEVKAELTKVVWPTRDQVIRFTLVVIAVSVIFGFYIGGLDLIFTKFTDLLVGN